MNRLLIAGSWNLVIYCCWRASLWAIFALLPRFIWFENGSFTGFHFTLGSVYGFSAMGIGLIVLALQERTHLQNCKFDYRSIVLCSATVCSTTHYNWYLYHLWVNEISLLQEAASSNKCDSSTDLTWKLSIEYRLNDSSTELRL